MKVRVQIEEAGTRLSLQEARRIADIAEKAAAQQEFRVRVSMASMTEATLERFGQLFSCRPRNEPRLCLNWSRRMARLQSCRHSSA